jgi:hypothetical protein
LVLVLYGLELRLMTIVIHLLQVHYLTLIHEKTSIERTFATDCV